MNKPTLVVLAAGMGSRFGGLKQISPLGPCGEILLDYSVYDAALSGFTKVVFVIKRELEETFRELIGNRLSDRIDIAYAFQDLNDLPGRFPVSEGRIKPWGTGHAVWAARHAVSGPFGVVGSDDFFGRDTFLKLYDFTSSHCTGSETCMVGFRLCNTLTEHGSVSRGICETEHGMLKSVTERERIFRSDDRRVVYEQDGMLFPLDEHALVSMNVWGFPADTFDWMAEDLGQWLLSPGDPLKREYYLPAFVDRMAKSGRAHVTALETSARWYGVTYQEDVAGVKTALRSLHEKGEYPVLR